ncbi:MAG: hypothetical protein IEMM0006_0656 [bacterium]|nr:MAG: hypothetical protein IEMM0006_0656 [bacterium]
MIKNKRYFLTVFILTNLILLLLSPALSAGNDSLSPTIVFTFNIKEKIDSPVWHTTRKAMEQAEKEHADIILIQMNTYGGMLDAADSIRTKILHSKIPVYVFIDNNAASAGALIALASDSIYMSPAANIGAATVVDQSGKPLPDKYQSYMRSLMRSTAEAKGRDPTIAEAMVDPRIFIKGISDSGKVLTFTTSEAIANGYSEAEADNIGQVLKHAGIDNYTLLSYHISATDRIIRFLVHPLVSGILIMVIVGGIYFELQTPGIGFPIAAAVVAAVLYFAPLYLEGLSSHWEILLFLLGLVLIVLEIFVVPGFGITGILGITFMVLGLTLSLIRPAGPGFLDYNLTAFARALSIVIISMTLSIISSIWLTKRLFISGRFAYLGLQKTQPKEEGYTSASAEYSKMLGKTGVAHTKLRPAGKVVVENDVFDAVAEFSFIEKDKKVKVVGYQSSQLIVKQIND